MGLDDTTYGTVRSNILSTEPLPNLNRAYAMIIQEERVPDITLEKEHRSDAMAFAIQTPSHSRGRADGKEKTVACSSCKRTGHDAGSCFELIGYPDWWGDRPRGRGRGLTSRAQSGQRPAGNAIGGRGHGGQIRANAAQVTGHGTIAQGQITETDKSGISGLSSEQWNVSLNLLNTQKDGNQERLNGKRRIMEWIIDTGASHHMTGRLESMSYVERVPACPVGLLDGKETIAEKSGTVVFNEYLKLKNVLYVPNLKCSLISVSQLNEELNCVVQFNDKICVMQDRNSRMLIGAGEQREGLYYFRGIVPARAMTTVTRDTLTCGIEGWDILLVELFSYCQLLKELVVIVLELVTFVYEQNNVGENFS
ncbi:uncharacterized protein LOC142529454 [Primulina tabacum]|uniref:uncharacterized protein LOC142529454 n=1 Tax=Primulina tabacum TaxID=48773 RepID=UPI003F5AAF07